MGNPALTDPLNNTAEAHEGARATDLIVRLWREHVLQYWPLLAIAAVLMTVEGAALGGFAYLIQPLFDDLFAAGSMSGVAWVAFAISGLFLLRAVAGFTQRLMITWIGLNVTTALQSRLVNHLLALDLRFFSVNAPGALIERVRGDTAALQSLAASVVMSIGRDTITVISLLVVMLISDPIWTLTALIGLPVMVVPLLLLQSFIRSTSRQSREAAARLSTQLDEMFHGVQSIKLNRLEAHEDRRFGDEVRRFLRHAFRAQVGVASNPALIDVVAAIGFVAVLYYGGAQIIAGDKTVGEFMSFFTALGLIFEPLRRLSNIVGQVQAAVASLDRLYAVLETKPTILPPASPQPLVPGAIRFEDVHFGYDEADVLKGIGFTAQQGQTTGIVGPSGAGKTTIYALLTRLVDPRSGRISIGGTGIETVDIDTLRDTVAVVGQETALFDESIAQNIRLGRLDATEDAVMQAAKDAGVWEFAQHLPDGLDTLVGPRGSSLSGGQRQRVAIARAMLKAAPILLLDEPTSALDARSEKLVQAALERLSRGRTTLVIAHRLSTLRDADKIIVLDRGRVVEEGTHDGLMQAEGAYAKLHALQSAGIDPDL